MTIPSTLSPGAAPPPTAPTSGAQPTQPASGGSAAGTTFANGDFQTFLKMLTVQIKNQDPLNPMEGSDFAVQLATFSGVEQQVRTNDLLKEMAGSGAAGLNQMQGWLGNDVRTTDPVHWDGATPVTLDVQPAAGADRVSLIVLNAQGREVMRDEIGPGAGEVDWVGRGSTGTSLPVGNYRFRLESAHGAEVLGTSDIGAYARVTGAEMTPNGVRLSLSGGATTTQSKVTALRQPG